MTYIAALIGARSGSSLKHKNIRQLAGHPLLAYAIKAAQKVGWIDRVIVCTDSEEYAVIARQYGAEAPYTQPYEISQADSGDHAFIKYALDWGQTIPDLIVHLRPTTPLRDPAIIDKALRFFQDHSSATSLRSVEEMPESAFKCFRVNRGWLSTIGGVFDMDDANKPRQAFPATYKPNGYVDILRPDFIRSHDGIHGNQVLGFVTPPVVEVDTEEDFERLEYQARKTPKLVTRLFGDSRSISDTRLMGCTS